MQFNLKSNGDGIETDEDLEDEESVDEDEKKRLFELARKQHYQLKRHSIHSIDEDDLEQDRMDVSK